MALIVMPSRAVDEPIAPLLATGAPTVGCDDASPSGLPHARQECLAEMEERVEVDRQHPPPLLPRDLVEGCDRVHACVRDEHVAAPEARSHRLGERRDLGEDVDTDRSPPAASMSAPVASVAATSPTTTR